MSAQPLTMREFIKHSRLSRATIDRLRKAGKLPYLQPGGKGGKVLFPPDALEIAARAVAAPDSAGAAASPSSDTPTRLSGPAPKWTRPDGN